MPDYLREIEGKAIYIIREAYARFNNIGLLWSIGKDSTALLWMCRKAFYGQIPFPVIHIDTSYKFSEIYEFRDTYAKEWNLDLRIARNEEALEKGMGPEKGTKIECCSSLKTQALKDFLADQDLDGILLAIRRDEHGIRAKERVFSPRDEEFKWDYRNQPPELWDQFKGTSSGQDHLRIHPVLHMTELDIWNYIKQENIPMVSLYFAKDGKRYRSIGCETCCEPVDSQADTIDKIIEEIKTTDISERAGRAQDKEDAYTMQKLRSLGYM
ncbi:sulfate adenylyltransferase subunit CysD [Planctomycetota bacterium]